MMQAEPQAASTTPPSGRDPVAVATAKPPINPAAARDAVGARTTSVMLTAERYGWAMDEGAPVAYQVLDEGVPVYAADGSEVGTVDHVVAAPGEDIFHGLVIRTQAGSRFVAADQVASLHERGADLSIDAAAAAQLPQPHGFAPSLEIKDPTMKTHRWKEILDMVRLKGYLGTDWSDEN